MFKTLEYLFNLSLRYLINFIIIRSNLSVSADIRQLRCMLPRELRWLWNEQVPPGLNVRSWGNIRLLIKTINLHFNFFLTKNVAYSIMFMLYNFKQCRWNTSAEGARKSAHSWILQRKRFWRTNISWKKRWFGSCCASI